MKSLFSSLAVAAAVLISTATTAASAKADQSQTILSIAESTPELSKLVELVKRAGLADVLNSAGPLTVFAPTNEAFPNESFLPSGEALKDLLLYHVANGRYSYAQLASLPTLAGEGEAELRMANGQVNFIDERGGGYLTLDTFTVVTVRDIEAANGVIHIINHVLKQPGL